MATLEEIEKLLDKKMVDAIEKLLDKKLVILRQQITTDINQSIEENRKNIFSNSATLVGHTEELESLNEQHKQHEEKINELQKQLDKQNNELDELTNRTMRTNIVIRGLPEVAKEDTKQQLCEYLATLSREDPQVIHEKIDRAHRTPGPPRDDGKPRNIFANLIYSVDCKYYVNLSSKHCAKNKNSDDTVRVDHQYTKAVLDRRNLAMLERKKILKAKEYATCHLVYPAKLFGKKDVNQKDSEFIKAF